MNLQSADSVLEVGCGPGWFSHSLSASIPQGILITCDIQTEMLRLANRKSIGSSRSYSVAADAAALPFADDRFDTALLAIVLGETSDKIACIQETKRVTKNTGSIFVVETRRDSDFVTLDELHDIADVTGLRIERTWGPRWEYTARLIVAQG